MNGDHKQSKREKLMREINVRTDGEPRVLFGRYVSDWTELFSY